jgi:ABC-type sugar transport system permease subunit
MRPFNIVILVITVIESLRAYDLVYITTKGTVLPGLELLSMLVTQYILGQTQRIGYGSALAVVLLLVSLVPITMFLRNAFKKEAAR